MYHWQALIEWLLPIGFGLVVAFLWGSYWERRHNRL
jgi:hypothetical protein